MEAAQAAGAAAQQAPGWLAFLSKPEVWLLGLAVAVFLALYWAIRGAPVGQSARETAEPDAPAPSRRDRLVGLASLGVVLVACAAYIVISHGIPWSLPVFGLGFAAIVAAQRGARPHRHSSPILRRTWRFSETALTAALLAGILIVANVAAFRYGSEPFDLTREQAFTLEPETLAQLHSLKRPVTFTAFYYGRLAQALKQVDRVQQLLRLFQEANPEQVRIDFVNFHGDPVRADELIRRVPDAASTTGGVVVEIGEGKTVDRIVVRNSEMFPEPTGPAAAPGTLPAMLEFRGEYALTTALIRLREGEKPRIALTTGHGESPPGELDIRRRGAGLLKSRLADVGFEVSEVNLNDQDVPEEMAIVLVVGPKSTFRPAEVDRLRAFLDGGGRGLFFVSGREKSGLEGLFQSYNIKLGKALVVEPSGPLKAPSATVAVPIPDAAEHPIVRTLAGQTVAVPGASPLTIIRPAGQVGAAPNPDFAPEAILQTGASAWGETGADTARVAFDPKEDVPGPITVGVAIAESKSPNGPSDPEKPRLVLFSSGDLANNRFARFVGFETNLDLAVNAAQWLRGPLDLPTIAPRTRTVARLNPDPIVQNKLILLPTLLAVSILLGLATAVFLARRS